MPSRILRTTGRPRKVAQGTRFYEPGYVGPVWKILSGVFQLDADMSSDAADSKLLQAGELLGEEIWRSDSYAYRATALTPARVVQLLQTTQDPIEEDATWA